MGQRAGGPPPPGGAGDQGPRQGWATGQNDQGDSRLHILKACEDSLRRLATDYIDLYQVHRPVPEMPPDETLGALTDLVRSGKVRYIGCSTHPAWMVMEALAVSERHGFARYVSEQPPYNLLDRRIENELIPLALRYNLAILPWAPLAQGVLAGRYPAGAPLPGDSRAARQPGSIYAERVTPRGIEAGARFARAGARVGPHPGPARAPLVQGPAGRHRSHRRPEHAGADRRPAAGAGDDPHRWRSARPATRSTAPALPSSTSTTRRGG